jgi:hypothetical protein
MWKWLKVSIRSTCPNDYCIGQYLSTPFHCSIRKFPNQKAHGLLWKWIFVTPCLHLSLQAYNDNLTMKPHVHELKLFTFAIINLGLYINLLLLKISHHTLILNPLIVRFFMINIILPTYVLHHPDLMTINGLPTLHTLKTWKKKFK